MSALDHRLNAYICDACSAATVTYHVDEGTTPMFLACRAGGFNPITREHGCGGMAVSRMYDVDPADYADRERYAWYKPDRAEFLRLDDATAHHVDMGGVLLRERPDRP